MQNTVRSRDFEGQARVWSRRLLWSGTVIAVMTLSVALVAGLVAFFATPAFDHFGDGPGGLQGIPTLTLLGSAVLGVPMLLYSLVSVARGRRQDGWYVLSSVLPWVTALGYFFIAHAFDPCALGIFGPSSTFMDAPLCGAGGTHPETSARLHLLHHALVPTLPLVTLQVLLLRKYGRQ